MEIILELECGLDVEFEPDFRMPNHSDETKVRWQLSDNADTKSVAGVFTGLETEESVPESYVSLGNLRLLYGYNP